MSNIPVRKMLNSSDSELIVSRPPSRPPRPPSRPANRPGSRHSGGSSSSSYRLPGDSVLFAPVYQEEKLESLFNKLQESSFEVSMMKEKLVEKAKNTLNLPRLPKLGSIIPFFHFDEFCDVHLSFLQHNPPYTPWFSITETYFGPEVIERHKKVYNMLLEHQNSRLSQDDFLEATLEDYDLIINIEYDDSYQPNYSLTPHPSQQKARKSFPSASQLNPSRSPGDQDMNGYTGWEPPFGMMGDSHEPNQEEPGDALPNEGMELSDQKQSHPETMMSNYSIESGRRRENDLSDIAEVSSKRGRDANTSGTPPSSSSSSSSFNYSKSNVMPENNSNFVESKRRASRPLRYSDFVLYQQ